MGRFSWKHLCVCYTQLGTERLIPSRLVVDVGCQLGPQLGRGPEWLHEAFPRGFLASSQRCGGVPRASVPREVQAAAVPPLITRPQKSQKITSAVSRFKEDYTSPPLSGGVSVTSNEKRMCDGIYWHDHLRTIQSATRSCALVQERAVKGLSQVSSDGKEPTCCVTLGGSLNLTFLTCKMRRPNKLISANSPSQPQQ